MLGVMAKSERDKPSRRMCAGCGTRTERGELVRLVVGDTEPFVAVDLGRRLAQVEPESLERMIVRQFEQRATGLLSAAQRARSLALGGDAVRTALKANKGDLLIRAKDSRGRGDELAHAATAHGCATATWGTKASLGDAFGRSELGVLLVTDRGIARAILDCLSHIEALSEDG
jgi:ribosomal protein L7Ae-like RNA K-turn-binding protein